MVLSSIEKQTRDLLPQLAPLLEEEWKRYPHIIPLFASDIGSRAFGFASPTSDFDVSFIFVQSDVFQYISTRNDIPVEATMEIKTQIHDSSIDKPLEVNCVGWDIIQFLRLMQKNNATVFHCITSPNVCYIHPVFGRYFHEGAVNCIPKSISMLGYFQSSLSVIRNNVNRFFFSSKLQDPTKISVKIYLYMLQYVLYAQEIYNIGIHLKDEQKKWKNLKKSPKSTPTKTKQTNHNIGLNVHDTSSTSSEGPLYSLPPLKFQELLSRNNVYIPPSLYTFILKLLKRKVNSESANELHIARNLPFEVWVLYNFKRLYSSRDQVSKQIYCEAAIDGFLKNFTRYIYHTSQVNSG